MSPSTPEFYRSRQMLFPRAAVPASPRRRAFLEPPSVSLLRGGVLERPRLEVRALKERQQEPVPAKLATCRAHFRPRKPTVGCSLQMVASPSHLLCVQPSRRARSGSNQGCILPLRACQVVDNRCAHRTVRTRLKPLARASLAEDPIHPTFPTARRARL
jgi:hypothetical protein